MVQSITITTGWLFTSQGRTDLQFRWACLSGLLVILCFIPGIFMRDIVILAACYALMEGVVLLYPTLEIPGRLVGLHFSELLHNFKGIIICSTVMAAIVFLFGMFLPERYPHWLLLAMKIILGVVVYSLMIHCFKLEAYLDVRSLLQDQWMSKKADNQN
jgi:PST family polysaccharide transporter